MLKFVFDFATFWDPFGLPFGILLDSKIGSKSGLKSIRNHIVEIYPGPRTLEYVGPQVRIPREKTMYIAGWKRLDPPQFGQKITKSSFEKKIASGG